MGCMGKFLNRIGLCLIFPIAAGCATESATTSSAVPQPVYNAIFSPTVPETKATFYDNQPTHVRFYIGRHDNDSAISADKWTVSSDIKNSTRLLPLVVTMSCLACGTDTVQKRVISYFPSEQRSSIAEFDFIPNKELAKSSDGFSHVIFDVSSEGVQLDHVIVDTYIVETSAEIGKKNEVQVKTSFTLPPEGEKSPDLVMTFFREPDQRLKVSILPIAPALKAKLGRTHLKSNGELKAFSAGDLSENEIFELLGDSYWHLKALVEQDNPALQSALSAENKNTFRLSSNSEVSLETPARDKVLERMYEVGSTLYSRIFNDGSKELAEVMRIIDTSVISNGPLRIRIETNNVYLPWQLLHPVATAGPYVRFWGLKYELAVTPLAYRSRGRLPAKFRSEIGHVLFAAYRGNQQRKDDVALLAAEQATLLENQFGKKGLSIATSREQFLGNLADKNLEVGILLAYTHASSGTILVKTDADVLTIQKDLRGSRLIFEDNDFVRPNDLYRLKINFQASHPGFERPFLFQRPLVFLNACETGTKGASPSTKLDFAGTFLDLGARGVIVTEAPVWKWFAYFFGKDLIQELANGHEVGSAIFALRNKYMKLGNPLGLLYSYYGNPSATIGSNNQSPKGQRSN